jgi:Ala-tRNA(Pro) deacylase
MNPALEKIQSYLDENGIKYRLIEHPAAGSADEYHETLGTRYEQQAKALFIRYKKPGDKGFVVLALQAQKRGDLDRVARLISAAEVRLGTARQLEETTGCGFGELPPLGRLYGLQLLLDKDLLTEDEIYFNAGSLTTSIAVDPKLIETLEQPLLYQ